MQRNVVDRAEGTAREVTGRIKKGIGKLVGNERLEASGHAQELGGRALREAAKANERLKGAGEELLGAAKGRVGEVLDDKQMEVEGKAKELRGKARQAANR